MIESAVDVLPHDIELDTFLQSPQLQMAWFTTLTLQKVIHTHYNLFEKYIFIIVFPFILTYIGRSRRQII